MQRRGGEPPGDGADVDADPDAAMNPLQRLIIERLRDRAWSYGAVARRGGLSRSTVFYLATTSNLTRPPRPDTLDGLARGLDVPISLVRAAAAEAAGLHYYGEPPDIDRETSALIASLEELSPEQRRHVAALIESLRSGGSSGGGSDDPGPRRR